MRKFFALLISISIITSTSSVSCTKSDNTAKFKPPQRIQWENLKRPKVSFTTAKKRLQRIYQEMNKTFREVRTSYCGCRFNPESKDIIKDTCGYVPRKDTVRARRIEWEHVVPAAFFGRHRACWKRGGRANCRKTDSVFKAMEADMVNLLPTIGELNALRSDKPYGTIPGEKREFGKCDFEVTKTEAEIREEIKGEVARIRIYMRFKYKGEFGKDLSTKEVQKLLTAARRNTPSPEEQERNRLISTYPQGGNPLVELRNSKFPKQPSQRP